MSEALHGKNLFLFILAVIALQFTGCASPRSRPDAVRQLSGLTIVVDSTVVEGRSFKHDLINVPQNLAIAEKIGEAAAALLKGKGYTVNDVHLYSVGAPLRKGAAVYDVALGNEETFTYPAEMTGKEARQAVWSGPVPVDEEEASVEPENKKAIMPPFAIKPAMGDDGRRSIRKFFQNLDPEQNAALALSFFSAEKRHGRTRSMILLKPHSRLTPRPF